MPKLPSKCYPNGQGNLCNLNSNKVTQPEVEQGKIDEGGGAVTYTMWQKRVVMMGLEVSALHFQKQVVPFTL